MSAGRFEWEATRFEHADAVTGASLVARKVDRDWFWKVDGVNIAASAPLVSGSGVEKTSGAAKSAARKALAAHMKMQRDRGLSAGAK